MMLTVYFILFSSFFAAECPIAVIEAQTDLYFSSISTDKKKSLADSYIKETVEKKGYLPGLNRRMLVRNYQDLIYDDIYYMNFIRTINPSSIKELLLDTKELKNKQYWIDVYRTRLEIYYLFEDLRHKLNS